jgi:5-methylcytosine-specific restriction endonuclease McrA
VRGRGAVTARQRVSKELRAKVLRRDGGICWICGQPGALTADHIKPLSHGGSTIINNLKAAHRSCNSRRGNRAQRTATNGYVR